MSIAPRLSRPNSTRRPPQRVLDYHMGQSAFRIWRSNDHGGDQHEALIRAYIDDVFNEHRLDTLDKYWNNDLTSHWLGMETIHGLPA